MRLGIPCQFSVADHSSALDKLDLVNAEAISAVVRVAEKLDAVPILCRMGGAAARRAEITQIEIRALDLFQARPVLFALI